MDNNQIINTLKSNITIDLVLNDFDSLIKSYIASRILEFDKYDFTKKLKSNLNSYTKGVKTQTTNYKKELKSIKTNNIGESKKEKQLLKNKYKEKLEKLQSKYNFYPITHLFNIVKMLNGNSVDDPALEVKTDIYNMFSVCNGLKSNLPFLVNFVFDYIKEQYEIGLRREEKHEVNLDEHHFIGLVNNILSLFSSNNYKHGFDSLFKSKKLISNIAKNKLHCNENEVGISSIFELSHVDDFRQFNFEKMCDTINLISVELSSDIDVNALDQTNTVNSFGEPFYEDEYVRIFRANTKEKSIEYGSGYGFCISTKTGFNYFNKYRFAKMGSCGYETTPHFVFFKNKEYQNEQGMYESEVNSGIFDKWNMCIIDLCWENDKEENHIWYYTTSRNDGTKKTNPDEIKKYAKDLESYPVKFLDTNKSKYNNNLSKALTDSKGFQTYPYTDQELLLKEYSVELGNSKEITLDTALQKKSRTVRDIFETKVQGRIFADVLMSNINEFKISNEVFKYIYEKFDNSKLSGDSIIGRTRYLVYSASYNDITDAIREGSCVKKLEQAIGYPSKVWTDEEIEKLIEEDKVENIAAE